MFISVLFLIITYFLFRQTIFWINYYNNLDHRMPNSLWRYACDYKVIGLRDICDLDDKNFVRLRRKRDKIVTLMYFTVVFGFVLLNYFLASLLYIILS